jgi:hypothetical protein
LSIIHPLRIDLAFIDHPDLRTKAWVIDAFTAWGDRKPQVVLQNGKVMI